MLPAPLVSKPFYLIFFSSVRGGAADLVFLYTRYHCHPVAGPRGPGDNIFIKFGFYYLGSMVKPWNDKFFIFLLLYN